MQFIIDKVRCFSDRQTIPLKPLTLLVGENSSGKTTILSALHTLLVRQPLRGQSFDFNAPPFAMGGFDNIASIDSNTKKVSSKFKLGWISDDDEKYPPQKNILEFKKQKRAIVLNRFIMSTDKCTASIYWFSNRILVSFQMGRKRFRFEWMAPYKRGDTDLVDIAFYLYLMKDSVFEMAQDGKSSQTRLSLKPLQKTKMDSIYLENIINLLTCFGEDLSYVTPVISLAPVRSKALRTYEPFTLNFDPEGGHVPAKYAEFIASYGKEVKDSIKEAINNFGKKSGLFDDIKLTSLGGKTSSPFKVLLTVGGIEVNLADVGYGVSQILPIVIESVLAKSQSVCILQQPEVHLHPKAQAELGTFFCAMAERANVSFVVETHSDYIIDRIRFEVARGNINEDKIGLLYFDKNGPQSKIHSIHLDDIGNIIDAPKTYRKFFLDEELKMLNRG